MTKTIISFSEEQFSEATAWRGWELEDTAYCTGFSFKNNGTETVLVRDVLVPKENELERSGTYVRPSPEFHCRLYNLAKATGASHIIQLHDHPFTTTPHFSGTDDAAGIGMARNLKALGSHATAVQLVFGRGNTRYSGRIVLLDQSGESFVSVSDIETIGTNGIRRFCDGRADAVDVEGDFEPLAFEKRNIQAFGEKPVRVLHTTRVLVVGSGGLGSAVAHLLVHLGCRRIAVMDCQRLDDSNINREYFVSQPSAAVGRFKASFLAKAMRRFNPLGKFRAINGNIHHTETLADAIKSADVVIVTLDSQSGRAILNSACARYAKPMLNVGNALYLNKERVLSSAFASCNWFFPRESGFSCLRCQGALDDDKVAEELMSERLRAQRTAAGYVAGTNLSPEPQVIPINSIAAGLAAWQLVMWLGGMKQPTPWTHYDVMNNRLNMLKPQANPECTVCGLGMDSCLATGDADLDMTTADFDASIPLIQESPLTAMPLLREEGAASLVNTRASPRNQPASNAHSVNIIA